MAVGIIVGTYSSLYITTPILLALQKRYGVTGTSAPAAKKGGRRGEKESRAARA